MADEVEVLVHISTPATRQNDILFRSLAEAYTEFEPAKAYRDEDRKGTRASQKAEVQSAGVVPASSERAIAREDVNLTPTASKESYGSFPSNVSSEWRRQSHDSLPEDSIRPISRLAKLDYSYRSWRNAATPTSSSRRNQDLPETSSDGLEDADTGFIEDSQSALEALQSQLHDECSATSADTSEDSGGEGGEDVG
ncbi:hypothetical protein E8E13_009176 [Curvularia kusanoi]|uniref:Uncharacterized protein n=1 Tax=Curvularia kusanoi TaxID=90978 RepID=A0A9P4TDP5_CURKU|nr:hypothetical protein E8E13_009176 [Curvularia kusanoi]